MKPLKNWDDPTKDPVLEGFVFGCRSVGDFWKNVWNFMKKSKYNVGTKINSYWNDEDELFNGEITKERYRRYDLKYTDVDIEYAVPEHRVFAIDAPEYISDSSSLDETTINYRCRSYSKGRYMPSKKQQELNSLNQKNEIRKKSVPVPESFKILQLPKPKMLSVQEKQKIIKNKLQVSHCLVHIMKILDDEVEKKSVFHVIDLNGEELAERCKEKSVVDSLIDDLKKEYPLTTISHDLNKNQLCIMDLQLSINDGDVETSTAQLILKSSNSP